ncbi:MAG: hypothetical protein IJT31_08320 [Oscillibacter sp.]|nr:hypothetical protein [Oscillibacter sp.]
MKRNILAVMLLCLSLLVCACGATPEKSAPEASGDAETVEPDAETVDEIPDAETPDKPYDAGTADETPELDAEISEPDAGTLNALPESGAADFSMLAGTWNADEGGTILTIYGNGGFELNQSDDTYEGYLVYTDAEGELWESGPRYELYLENNERVPNCYFALDDAQPGKLVYAVGGGAELFSRGDSAYDAAGIVVRVQWANETWTDCDQFTAYSGDYEVGIIFSASRTLRDFKVLSISLEDVDEDGMPVFSVLELYTQDTLTPERPLFVQTSFPGDMPTNGISYLDDDGTTRYFSVSESGFDGSLILSEFARSDTP